MSPATPLLLTTFWSWVAGIAATAVLGLLLPITAALTVAMFVLALRRRDWREPAKMLPLIALFASVGFCLLGRVTTSVPGRDFWWLLSGQIGAIAFFAALFQAIRIVWARLRRDAQAAKAVTVPLHEQGAERSRGAEPGPRPRLSGVEAEYYVAEWMRFLGAVEAVVTPPRRDGGVDVRSKFYVAQVKHRPGDFVSVESLRALIGVAKLEGRIPLFFSSGNFSRDCFPLAAQAGVALFLFQPRDGRLVPANPIAQRLWISGLRGIDAEKADSADEAAVHPVSRRNPLSSATPSAEYGR